MDEYILNSEDEKRIESVRNLIINEYPKLKYHNVHHGIDVWQVFRKYAFKAKLPYDDRVAGELAALLHDIVNVVGGKDNEERSSDFARNYLPSLGFSHYVVEKAAATIMPTKMPQRPLNLLEKLLCDADLDNLGRDDFFEKNELLREELGITDKQKWYSHSLDFLASHEYHTRFAQELRNEGKKQNLEKLQFLLEHNLQGAEVFFVDRR